MVCSSLIPLSTVVGWLLEMWAADGKCTFLGFCSIIQAPLRHQKYSLPGMPVDSEHGYPICSLDSFGQLAGPWNIWKGQWEPTIMLAYVWPSCLATPAWPSADLSFLDSLTSDHSKHCCQVHLLKSPFKVVKPCLKDQQGLFFVSRRVLNTSISDRPVLHSHRPSNTLLTPPSQSLPMSSLGLEFLLHPSPPSIYLPSPDNSNSQGFLQQIAYIVQHLNCSLDK